MPEQGSQLSFKDIYDQKRQALQELVNSYGGVMVGHPSVEDVEALANLQARHAMGEKISKKEIRKAEELAAKFKGSFC